MFEYIFLKGEADRPDWTGDGDVNCSETPNCGYCYKTTTFRHLAKSPAYVIDGYDFSNAEYSAWAESVWKVGLQFSLPSHYVQSIPSLCSWTWGQVQ